MKRNTKIYSPFKGYTLEDCDCRYCLYYGGKRRRRVLCLADVCVCKSEIEEAVSYTHLTLPTILLV